MNMFDLLTTYFWVVAIILTSVNVASFKRRSRVQVQEKPELEHGYATLFRRYLIFLNLPWVVMGIGCTIGGVPSLLHYFRPTDGNPNVLAWFASIFLLWITGTYWLFLRDGAEMLFNHPGAFIKTSSPTGVKIFWLLCLASGVFGVVLMLTFDVPLPLYR